MALVVKDTDHEFAFGCDNRIVGVVKVLVTDEHPDGITVIETKCQAKKCKESPGEVVLHYFDRETLQYVTTKRFKDPVHQFPVLRDRSKKEE